MILLIITDWSYKLFFAISIIKTILIESIIFGKFVLVIFLFHFSLVLMFFKKTWIFLLIFFFSTIFYWDISPMSNWINFSVISMNLRRSYVWFFAICRRNIRHIYYFPLLLIFILLFQSNVYISKIIKLLLLLANSLVRFNLLNRSRRSF